MFLVSCKSCGHQNRRTGNEVNQSFDFACSDCGSQVQATMDDYRYESVSDDDLLAYYEHLDPAIKQGVVDRAVVLRCGPTGYNDEDAVREAIREHFSASGARP